MKTTTEPNKSTPHKSKPKKPAPHPLPAPLAELLTNLANLTVAWEKLADVKEDELPSLVDRNLLVNGAEKIGKAIRHFHAFIMALEGCATHYETAKEPKAVVAAGQSMAFLGVLDEIIAKIVPQFIALLNHRAPNSTNFDLLRLAMSTANGNGDDAVKYIRRFEKIFPDADKEDDNIVGDENPVGDFAWEIYSRLFDMNALADEFPAHMRTVAVQMNAWPMLQFPGRDNRERFEEIAARFDLGSACTPDTEESSTSETSSTEPQNIPCAAQPPAPQFVEEPLQPEQPASEPTNDASPYSPPVSSPTMTLPRKGKIGRLPLRVREQLNLRIADGVETTPLLAWLNAQVDTQEILRRDFASRPVTPQNLSEWCQGGFQDWLRAQRTLDLARDMAEQADSLDKIMGAERYSERLSTIMAAQLAQIAIPLMEETGDLKQRWTNTRQVLKELARLRHSDYLATKVKLTARKNSTSRSSELDLSTLFPV